MGLVIGIVLPGLFFALLFVLDFAAFNIWSIHLTDRFDFLFLLSFAANLLPIRYYLVSLKFEKTGMGILLATIAEIIVYFFMYFQA